MTSQEKKEKRAESVGAFKPISRRTTKGVLNDVRIKEQPWQLQQSYRKRQDRIRQRRPTFYGQE